jgi:hypothetical protein
MALEDLNEALDTGLRVPHQFHLASYTKPTYCYVCKKLLVGLFRQGKKCTNNGCGINVHSGCVIAAQRLEDGCKGGLAQVQVHLGGRRQAGDVEPLPATTATPVTTFHDEKCTQIESPAKRMQLDVEATSEADYAAMEAALSGGVPASPLSGGVPASPASDAESVGEAASDE